MYELTRPRVILAKDVSNNNGLINVYSKKEYNAINIE